jgi:flagellar biosynthesis/type III secretory pathway ATPase
MVEIAGPIHAMSVGARIGIETTGNRFIPAEVIAFSGSNAVVMPFAGLEGVRRGCRAVIANAGVRSGRPSPSWLGRVLNAMGTRLVMATYAEMKELIRLGAYRAGSNPEVDEAIALHEPLEAFLRQAKDEKTSLGDGYRQFEQILGRLETER